MNNNFARQTHFLVHADHHVKFEVEVTNLNKAPHSDFYYFRYFILKWNAADFGIVDSNL